MQRHSPATLRRDHVLVEILAVCSDQSDEPEERRHQQWARDTNRGIELGEEPLAPDL
ncbi:MAG TPA: hypothetical protein VE091_02770 [Gemmatimonadales bacterium]|nr:hypothetical protein [Gemmatimonadales bacterium]